MQKIIDLYQNKAVFKVVESCILLAATFHSDKRDKILLKSG